MEPVPIQVQCYSGHQPSPMGYGLAGKADERPLQFVCEGVEIEVVEVLDQWLAASSEAGQSVLVP